MSVRCDRAKKLLKALELALQDQGPAPEEWIVNRICEEFHCVPTVAIRELERAPLNLIRKILDMRAYVRARGQLEEQENNPDAVVEYDEMTTLVQEIQAEAWAERKRR